MIHELEDVPKQKPLRNDSVMDEVSDADVTLWKALFGFTAAEARYELLAHRWSDAPKVTQVTHDHWSWEQCEEAGFDKASWQVPATDTTKTSC
jgi:hypothetical protein